RLRGLGRGLFPGADDVREKPGPGGCRLVDRFVGGQAVPADAARREQHRWPTGTGSVSAGSIGGRAVGERAGYQAGATDPAVKDLLTVGGRPAVVADAGRSLTAGSVAPA